jgi:hypothetical protein
MRKRVQSLIPTEPPAIDLLTRSDQDAVCVGCRQAPRRHDGVPLAAWIGRPRVCICHVCLTTALIELGFIDPEELEAGPDPSTGGRPS